MAFVQLLALAIFMLLFLLPFLVLFVIPRYNKRSKREAHTHERITVAPYPPRFLFVGNLHQLGLHPHHSLHSLAKEHGPSLMSLQLGEISAVVVSSKLVAEQIMKMHDLNFASRPSPTAARKLSYGCLDVAFAPYGDYWRSVRKICTIELLSMKRIRYLWPVIEEEVGIMVEKMNDMAKGSIVNLSEIIFSLTFDITCRMAFGKKYSKSAAVGEDFHGLFLETQAMLGGFFVGDYLPVLGWVDELTGMKGRLRKTYKSMNSFFDSIIDEHSSNNSSNKIDAEHDDFVDVLLRVQMDSTSAEFPITREHIKALMIDMVTAGSDTTAALLEWSMSELIRNPQVLHKVQNEIRSDFSTNNAKLDGRDLRQLDYLNMVLKETLRLHPPVPLLIPRQSREDCIVEGYHIPKNTRVLINAWAIGRDDKYWENPLEFQPERFKNNGFDYNGHDFEFIPFGSGRRSCPGVNLGIGIARFALAHLLYHFEWNLPEGSQGVQELDMEEAIGLTTSRKTPLNLLARKVC